MSIIPDDELFSHGARVKGKVVLITGAANGIGKEAALLFAARGAKIVIGDLNSEAGEATTREIVKSGGEAIFRKTNVVEWDDLVALFDLAISTYGVINVVVANAGVNEMGAFNTLQFDKNKKPVAPKLTTIQVNLIGLLYTVNLASHYLLIKHTLGSGDLKSLVFIGSMASWQGIPGATLYTASKHGVLGVMRSIWKDFAHQGIRVACIHPWFADTAILPLPIKVFLAGIPLATVPRIAGAIFRAATDTDEATNGSAWLIPNDGNVFLVPREEFKMGVYKMIDDRTNALLSFKYGILYYFQVFSKISTLLGKPLLKIGFVALAAKLVWERKDVIVTELQSLAKRS